MILNPFKGPAPYTEKDTLFGRDDELEDIIGLLISCRIVLFYSVSGAGKTSLIRAALCERMQKDGFHVLPVIRMNEPLPENLYDHPKRNRYSFSIMRSLESGLKDKTPEDYSNIEDSKISDLFAQLGLNNYLSQRSWISGNPLPKLFIFDQFEEILTTDETDYRGKKAFFKELGEVLENPNRWALFVVREDYLAEFDPFLRYIPTRFSNRYRLGHLRPEMALEAIKGAVGQTLEAIEDGHLDGALKEKKLEAPKVRKNIEQGFNQDHIDALIQSLRSSADKNGRSGQMMLPFIDPFHLQIFCYSYFERCINRTPGIKTMHKGLKEALEGYYDKVIKKCVEPLSKLRPHLRANLLERELREWIEDQMISNSNARILILAGAEKTQGLENTILKNLSESRLFTRRVRYDSTYYELGHDRLVSVIKESNHKKYRDLDWFKKKAKKWNDEGKVDNNQLLTGDDFIKLKKKMEKKLGASYERDLMPYEKDWLKACEKRDKILKVRFWIVFTLSITVFGTIVYLSYDWVKAKLDIAHMATRLAEQVELLKKSEEKLNEAAKKNQETISILKGTNQKLDIELIRSRAMRFLFLQPNHELAALLELQANKFHREVSKDLFSADLDRALRMTLQSKIFLHELKIPDQQNVQLIQVNNEGNNYAVLYKNKKRKKMDPIFEFPIKMKKKNAKASKYNTLGRGIISIAYSKDDSRVYALSEEGIEIFDSFSKKHQTTISLSIEPQPPIYQSTSGHYLGIISQNGKQIEIVNIENGEGILVPTDHELYESDKITSIGLGQADDSLMLGTEKGMVVRYAANSGYNQPEIIDAGWNKKLKSGNTDTWTDEDGYPVSYAFFSELTVVDIHPVFIDGSWGWAVLRKGGPRLHGGITHIYRTNNEGWQRYKLKKSEYTKNIEKHDVEERGITIYRNELFIISSSNIDGQHYAVGGQSGLVRYWDFNSAKVNEEKKTIHANSKLVRGHWAPIRELSFSKNGEILFSEDISNKTLACELNGLKNKGFLNKEVNNSERPVGALMFLKSPNNENFLLIAGDSNKKNLPLNLWEMDQSLIGFKKAVKPFGPANKCFKQIRRFSTSPDKRYLGIGKSCDSKAVVLDLRAPQSNVYELGGHKDAVWGIDFYKKKNLMIATGSYSDKRLAIWEKSQDGFKEINNIKLESEILDLAFHPEKGWLVVACLNGDIYRISDITPKLMTKKKLSQYRGHSVCFNDNGTLLAIGNKDNGNINVLVCNGEQLNRVGSLKHEGGTNDLIFSPRRIESPVSIGEVQIEFNTLASGGKDGNVNVWKLDEDTFKNPNKISPITYFGAHGEVLSIGYNHDGSVLAAGDCEYHISLWSTDPARLSQIACDQLWRNLTCEEWATHIGRHQYTETCSDLMIETCR